MEQITGKTLIEWGYKPGDYFREALVVANNIHKAGYGEDRIRAAVDKLVPQIIPLHSEDVPFFKNIDAENDLEKDNISKVETAMRELMKTPTITAGAVMPDACPTGAMPVGGVVAAKNAIHPGFHSSDICCSMAISVFDSVDPADVLATGKAITHFGPGGRNYSHDMRCPESLLEKFEENPFLQMLSDAATKHFGTQGDGNHFFFVGTMRSTGQTALVTHHGSRKPGAVLYKNGMDVAKRYRNKISPETQEKYAWIPADTQDGEDYWEALQLIRTWTKKNHFAIHDAVAKNLNVRVKDRFWNEHNFVFQKSDGLFYHGKGATPAWRYFAADATDLTIIPLNMAQPILIVRGSDNANALGFSPHGAGRNFSRTQHIKSLGQYDVEEILKKETEGIEAHFMSGIPDISELPSAYKDAVAIQSQIEKYNLAEVVDYVDPYGSIMAGDWQAIYRQKRKKK